MSPFLMAIRVGNYREVAARYAGISPATLYRWLKRTEPEYVAFRRVLDMVEAEVEVMVTTNLFLLSRTSTSAALAWLRTRYPKR